MKGYRLQVMKWRLAWLFGRKHGEIERQQQAPLDRGRAALTVTVEHHLDAADAAMGNPAVAEAAAIGIAHPRWDERPLLLVIRKPGAALSAEDMIAFLAEISPAQ